MINLKKFLVIDSIILPDIFLKVLLAKECLYQNPDKPISEIVRDFGISRSTFYKYKDYVFSISDGTANKKCILSFILVDKKGVLSSILKLLSDENANVLTINQDIPINKLANATITIEISTILSELDTIVDRLKIMNGIVKCEILALE